MKMVPWLTTRDALIIFLATLYIFSEANSIKVYLFRLSQQVLLNSILLLNCKNKITILHSIITHKTTV